MIVDTNKFDELLHESYYARDSYEHSKTCSADTYKRQEKEASEAHYAVIAYVKDLLEQIETYKAYYG